MRVRFWGTRGSIPTPGPDTVTYGGNTSCIEVILRSGRSLIFDAGSGIRMLGLDLQARPSPNRLALFISHVHWDHIQGFPFFAAAYDPETTLDIYGLPYAQTKVDLLLSSQMEQVYFPVDMQQMRAEMLFHDLGPGALELPDARVLYRQVNHTTETLGFRVEAEQQTLVFIPDNELSFCALEGRVPYEDIVAFCRGADLLIHDAQYTAETYRSHRGWGHSTREEAVKLADDAGVRRLAAFHHDPRTSDAELAGWEESLKGRSGAQVFAAREGSILPLAD